MYACACTGHIRTRTHRRTPFVAGDRSAWCKRLRPRGQAPGARSSAAHRPPLFPRRAALGCGSPRLHLCRVFLAPARQAHRQRCLKRGEEEGEGGREERGERKRGGWGRGRGKTRTCYPGTAKAAANDTPRLMMSVLIFSRQISKRKKTLFSSDLNPLPKPNPAQA